MSADRDTLDLDRLERAIAQFVSHPLRDDLEWLIAEVRRLRDLRQRGCDCSDDDACRYARERDALRAELEAKNAAIRDAEHGPYCELTWRRVCNGCPDCPHNGPCNCGVAALQTKTGVTG